MSHRAHITGVLTATSQSDAWPFQVTYINAEGSEGGHFLLLSAHELVDSGGYEPLHTAAYAYLQGLYGARAAQFAITIATVEVTPADVDTWVDV